MRVTLPSTSMGAEGGGDFAHQVQAAKARHTAGCVSKRRQDVGVALQFAGVQERQVAQRRQLPQPRREARELPLRPARLTI